MKKNLLLIIFIFFSFFIFYSNSSANSENKDTKEEQKIKFSLRVAIVRGDGTILPVPRTDFVISSIKKKREKEKSKENNINQQNELKNIVLKMYESECQPKNAKYSDTYKKILFDQCIEDKINFEKQMSQSNGSSFLIKTDLSGHAKIELTPGVWYINGSYTYASSRNSIIWVDVPIFVNNNLIEFELSNDNGEIVDNLW